MDLFINDKILHHGRTLKTIAIEAGEPMQAVAAELGIRFELIGPDRRPLDGAIKLSPPDREQIRLRGALAYSTAQASVEAVAPGHYTVAARAAEETIDERAITILALDEYNAMLDDIAEEPLERDRPYGNPVEVEEAWRDAWRTLFAYLGGPVATHIAFQVAPLKITEKELAVLAPEALEWAVFHVLRFLFDQLFLGGRLDVQRGEGDAGAAFRITVGSDGPPLSAELPDDVRRLLRSLAPDNAEMEARWRTMGREGVLELVWQG